MKKKIRIDNKLVLDLPKFYMLMRKIITAFIFLGLFSCGEYQKILKSPDLDYKYEKAIEYYKDKDFTRAMPLFRELSNMMRGDKRSEEIMYYLAYCHYNAQDFNTSYYLFRNYVKTYPNGSHIEECSYMSSYCLYMESPSYSLDDTYTKKAINTFESFLEMYPATKYRDTSEILIKNLNNKLIRKSFENAKQYYNTENYASAIIALNNCLIDFRDSKFREETYFLILKSSYALAINSIEEKRNERLNHALDAYSVFSSNYPNSIYKSQSEKIEKEILLILK